MGGYWCQLRVSGGGNKGYTLGVVSLGYRMNSDGHVTWGVRYIGMGSAQVGTATASQWEAGGHLRFPNQVPMCPVPTPPWSYPRPGQSGRSPLAPE